jgi:DNA invertase Pin-like site-specific DNA recombinase
LSSATEQLELTEVFVEAEPGSGSDVLDRRPKLAAALKMAGNAKVPVLVAKLNRLSRDLHFVSGLMSHRVEFIVCDRGRQSGPFMLHLNAALGANKDGTRRS